MVRPLIRLLSLNTVLLSCTNLVLSYIKSIPTSSAILLYFLI
nr:MAG TPA: hypothetical protein [Crassvirales sp.]DAK71239.1 MAG TPA: hypothetical protein [Caudoviricetes sp.]DAP79222.1 MAG TPA: hypothetical protein [Caudoviricetes sp.]